MISSRISRSVCLLFLPPSLFVASVQEEPLKLGGGEPESPPPAAAADKAEGKPTKKKKKSKKGKNKDEL